MTFSLTEWSGFDSRNHVDFYVSFPPPGVFGGTLGNLGKAFTAFIRYFSMSLISFISGLSWISPSCSRRNLANTNPGAGLVSRVSLSKRGYLRSTPIMSFSPCFKKRKDSCSFCHPTISLSHWAGRSKFGIKLIWPKLWEKLPRCIRVGGNEGGPSGESGRMAITSKNIHKIKHQRERENQELIKVHRCEPSSVQTTERLTWNEQDGGRRKALGVLPSAAWAGACRTVWEQPGISAPRAARKGEEREGRGGRRGRGRMRMTGQVWNLHSPLVVHAIGVMSHPYCCGRVGGMLVIYDPDEGKWAYWKKQQPSSDFKLFIVPFGMLLKDKMWCLML